MSINKIYQISIKLASCFILAVFYFFFYNESAAQTLSIRNYNAEHGLAQSQVYDIIQDNDGYMWFATSDGLSRFDGKTFKNYNVNDGLAGNYVYSACLDKDMNIWFGHLYGKITILNWQTKKFETTSLSNDDSDLAHCTIRKIFMDKKGALWFTTEGRGVFRYNGKNFTRLSSKDGMLSNTVHDICQTSDDALWFTTSKGISIYDYNQKDAQYQFDSLTVNNGLPSNKVISILEDKQGGIWIGTKDKGVIRYRPEASDSKGEMTIFGIEDGLSGLFVYKLYQDREGCIWLGNYQGGVSKFIPPARPEEKGYFYTIPEGNGLSDYTILSIFQDREGNLWFGMDGNFVSQFREDGFENYGVKEGLTDNTVWSVLVDKKGTYWFGTERGITKYVPPKPGVGKAVVQNFTKIEGKQINDVMCIFEDSRGEIWFMSWNRGMLKLNSTKNGLKRYSLIEEFPSNNVITMNEDDNGCLWFGSLKDGILRYDPKNSTYRHFNRKNDGLSSDTVFVIYKDKKSNLWFGTDNGGIIKYDGEKFYCYSKKQGYPIRTVLSIAEDVTGNIWLATTEGFLFKFDGKKFTDYSFSKGINGKTIFSVISDDETIWVGTSRGIARMDQSDSTFVHYGKSEGYPILENNQNAVFRDRNGYLWFGAIGGAVKYNPQLERKNNIVPPIHITKLRIFLKDAPMPLRAEFTCDKNYLSFHFIGVSLTIPEKVKYKYKLEGFDKEWSPETKENYVTYSNIPPGQYAFKVKACNNDGIWNPQPAVYEFEILTPFWQTLWFYSLVILIIALTIYFAHKRRLRKSERDKEILEVKIEQRTAELVKEKEKVEHAYKALRESEAKFRGFTETTSSAIFIFRKGNFCYVNPAAEAIFGYTQKELFEMKVWDLIHPDFKKLVRKPCLTSQADEQIITILELKIVTSDKRERWINLTAKPIEFEGQTAIICTAFDITERRTAEYSLLAEKERLAVTLRSIADGVITTDVKGRVVLINKAAKEITGWEQEKVMGKPLSKVFNVISARTGKAVLNPAKAVVKKKGMVVQEPDSVLISKDKARINIAFSSAPIRDKDNKIIGVVLVFRDITEKRKLEEELLKAQKLESVGILAGGIAHDFNNILTAITGNLSLTKMYIQPGEKIYDWVDVAEKATGRAQELTEQLLTFSKGGMPVKKTTSIDDLIKDSATLVLRGSNVKCVFDFEDNLLPVKVDAGQISQVIHNLVINSDQAMPEGGKLYIWAKNIDIDSNSGLPLKPGKYIQIEIQDKGIGISAEYLPKIFDPFFTTKQSGSGLGLATSYSIVKKHQGHITVESILGGGTTFCIYLPVSEEKPITPEAKTEKLYFKGRGRVLVMDDEYLVRETIGRMLSHLGFDVEFTKDGQEAIDRYEDAMKINEPFDVVIMDLTIPGGMGGQKAIQKLFELDPKVTAIVTTGYSNDPVIAEYMQYGFKGYLKKPFNVDEIAKALKDLEINQN